MGVVTTSQSIIIFLYICTFLPLWRINVFKWQQMNSSEWILSLLLLRCLQRPLWWQTDRQTDRQNQLQCIILRSVQSIQQALQRNYARSAKFTGDDTWHHATLMWLMWTWTTNKTVAQVKHQYNNHSSYLFHNRVCQ